MSILFFAVALVSYGNAKLTGELALQLDKEGFVSCIMVMKEAYPYEALEKASLHEKIINLKSIAQVSQGDLVAWLRSRPGDVRAFKSYWVLNGIYIEAKASIIKEIAGRSDVGWISHNGEVHVIAEPVPGVQPAGRGTEWGIRMIKADSCWTAGITGQGVILGMTDTGVDHDHPALAGKWSGYWLDAINGQTTPYDDHSGTWHGTHCMGTILGGDGPGPFTEDIGVAPGATFVAAKVLNSSGSGTYNQCLAGLQFMADLKDSVDIKAVSNSWGGSNGSDTFFFPIARTYKSINIMPVFANGNSGPGSGTVGCPGANSNVLGVGATDSTDAIANFSSRGPAPNQAPFNDPTTWFRSDWNLIKPQISAPGVNVRSAKGDGSGTYHNLSGTSMATPHVAGAIGLICQKNPNLSTTELYSILIDNADLPSGGGPYPNNNYGWGRLNVWRALNGTPTTNQPWLSLLSRTVTDPPPGGNNNGIIEPGETARVVIEIKNVGGDTARSAIGTLKSYDNFVRVTSGTYGFGNLLPQQNATNLGSPFTFDVHSLAPQGHKASLGIVLHADGDHDTLDFDDTLYFSVTIGTPPAAVTIYQDDFEYGSGIDSFLNYWDKTGNWSWSTTQSHSATHSAYSGTLIDGTVNLTLKNAMDLTGYSGPTLIYWDRWNWDNGFWTDAWVDVSTDGGTNWTAIWTLPTNPSNTQDWTEKSISLASYITANVKIRFRLFSRDFFQNFNDWWVDDFKICVPADNEPPYFSNTTDWPDTSYTGPFIVNSTITDNNGIDSAYLYYRVNSGGWQKTAMSHQGNNVYQASIPAQPSGSTVNYYLWARDKWVMAPNSGCDPVGAPSDGYYSFYIGLVGVEEHRVAAIQLMSLVPNPSSGDVQIRYLIKDSRCPMENVCFRIYDATGRMVRDLTKNLESGIVNHESAISWNRMDDKARRVPAGVYFLRFKAGAYIRVDKLILIN